MDFYLLILFVLTSATVSIKGQSTETYSTCNTPNRSSGICVPLESCEMLYRITQKPSLFRSEFNLLRGSQCGNGASWVCCPDESRSTPSTTQSTRPTTRSTPITTRPTPRTTRSTPRTTRSTPQEMTTTRKPSTTSMTSSSDRISIRKCNEYKEFAYNKSYTYDPINRVVVSTPISNCARNIRPTVIGGEEAIQREFPHMALIGFLFSGRTVWACGGSLISEQFVLSAAHCISDPKAGIARYVRLGEHDLNQEEDASPMDFNIIQRIVYPDYPRQRPHHDIALFKLSGSVTFSDAIRPICLPEQSVVPPKFIATGWGRTSEGSASKVLLKVDLDIFSYSQCFNISTFSTLSNGIDDQYQICAGSQKQQKDTCNGDSGGPLQGIHESHHCTYTVYGITSFGPKKCGTIGVPGVYTRVYSYLSWIESIVWPNE